MLNDMQRAVLATYLDGAYSHMVDELDAHHTVIAFTRHLQSIGDDAFMFLMLSMRAAPTPEAALASLMEAHQAIKTAQEAIVAVRDGGGFDGGT